MIDPDQRIVFSGGQGFHESNIPDFRSSDGVYSVQVGRHLTAEQLVSHTMFERYQRTFDFYKKLQKPNAAHRYLAQLEGSKLKAVVTQNIDSLHEMAGSKKVFEASWQCRPPIACTGRQRFYDLEAFLALEGPVSHCLDCGRLSKPDVTLYEDLSIWGLWPSSPAIQEAISH